VPHGFGLVAFDQVAKRIRFALPAFPDGRRVFQSLILSLQRIQAARGIFNNSLGKWRLILNGRA
jgi:hypothetical protein